MKSCSARRDPRRDPTGRNHLKLVATCIRPASAASAVHAECCGAEQDDALALTAAAPGVVDASHGLCCDGIAMPLTDLKQESPDSRQGSGCSYAYRLSSIAGGVNKS